MIKATTKDPATTRAKEWIGEPTESADHLMGRMRAEGDDPDKFTFAEDSPEIVGREPIVITFDMGLPAALQAVIKYFEG